MNFSRIISLLATFLCFGALVATLPATALGQVITIHVNANATPPGNGQSWFTPYTDLQAALAVATQVDVIAVAAGTYKPSIGTTRSDTFTIGNEVKIYDSFARVVTETDVSHRPGLFSQTILSGDLGQGIHSYHVVTINGILVDPIGPITILDGFKIQGGSATTSLPQWIDLAGAC